ncbi:MAG TPA: hypothetical protein DHV01_09795 [Rhodoferax sp.]|uniref:tandem-95 repeat protein n=1 Tax=Rhodoferax sp. TaxID=50421 RepID=UPI0008D6DE0D|nr:tandem-95 repeat protein [Rhodoferax sp.]OGO94399.1 MAG: hypothetical protein A2037_07885 [Curvibacter sp. GWA2_63_95]HCX81881.1 hypothetical protein [Rhodoferax sp.]
MSGLNLQNLDARTVLASTFSRGTYNPATFQPPEGFVKLDVKPGDQKSPDFAAAAYVNPQTGELVVAYRGSDSKSDLVTAQQAASNGKWDDQFTDAASFAKLAQGLAATAIQKFADDNDVPAVTVKPLYTGHSLGGLLAQVMSKMFGVEAQVFDAPGGARLVGTEDFARVAQQNGQPAAGHDVTDKIQNYSVTTLISGLGEQLGEKIPIPALGQMSGMETLGAIASFMVNPLLGLTVTGGINTVEAHGSSNIEDAMYALAALQPHVANAGTLKLQGMYLGIDGTPTLENSPQAGGSNWRIQALVDPNGKVVAYFDRQSGEPFAVVAGSGIRISLEHKPGQDAPDVIEKHPDGTVITVPAKALLSSFLATTEQANPRQSGTADLGTQDDGTAVADAAYQQLVNAFNNFDTSQAGPGVQYADARNTTGNGDVVSDAGGSSSVAGDSPSNLPLAHADIAQTAPETVANTSPAPAPNPNNYAAYLSGSGASLSPAQQDALAAQLDALGLGGAEGAEALSFYPLPGGGVLIGNADGDIVGELGVSSTGEVRLQANTVNADGSAGTQDLHISISGTSTSHTEVVAAQAQAALEQAQFNAAANDAAGVLSLVNSLANLAHFDQLTDLGKAQSLISLYNQIDNLGSATAQLSGSTGGNLPLDLGQWGAGLNLVSALQGDDPIAQASAAGAFYNTFANSAGSSLTPIPVPYLQALNLIGAIESGNTVSMIASAVAFIPGWGTAASIAISIIAPLFADKPPPPEGVTHYEWDANGNIQIHVDFNQSHGGEIAQSTAQSVQGLLNSIVQSINDQTPDTADNVAINPYLLPRVGFSQSGGAWIEMTTPDGGSYREMIQGENLAQRLFDILTENGGIAPAWQVQTQLGHMQQLLDQGAGQGEIAAQLGAGAGGHAYHGNQAYAIEGNATESADFKTQSFGALVVHLGAGVVTSDAVQASTQALQDLQDQQNDQRVATSELYRDTEGDGYYEKTQWVSATDAKGNVQGMLVLDYNGNGQIETRDILNLGGNSGQDGNKANDALAASANAALQRNNVEWLDANGDGVLDKSDPAFAAIKLWVDLNQDARLDAGEQADLASLQITSINFQRGEVTYADGHSDALSSTTLQSDTEGLRYTQMQEADAEGNLHTINAGEMLEHEGYQGQVQVVDQGGVTRWGTVREATFEHDALTTGDWEGTAEQDQHRHGGTNVTSAPTQTSATAAVSLGAVKRADGQDRVLTDRRLVFVPTIATLGQERTDSSIDQMVRSAQEGVLAGGLGAGLGALSMVGLGAVQTTAFAAPDTERVHSGYTDDDGLETAARTPALDGKYASPLTDASRARLDGEAPASLAQGTWQEEPRRVVDAPPPPGVLADVDALQRAGLDLSAYTATHTPAREIRATLVSSGVVSTPSASTATPAATTPASAEMLLDLPKVAGEVLAGTEDTVLRIGTDLLLANDSTVNVGSNAGSAPLHISAVGNPSHGQVSLQTTVNGVGQTVTEVVFFPDADFYGTASFSYTVTDPYGLSSVATATLLIENVNDAPYAQGEVVSGASEDALFLINKSVLLANDGDVDDAPSALGIGWVGNALNGTVSLDANGNVVFTPGLNFNGNAEFEYMTVDAAGLLSPAVQVVMPVAAVNDAPLAVDDQFQTYVNSTMTIGFAQLIGNDSDIENDTLSLVDVGNASNGVVSIVNGQVEFVATPGFIGAASFDYLVDDSNGGQTWATAFVEVKPPPNLYASVDLYGASFYGTGGNSGWRIDMADVSFAVSDDGDTAFSSVALQSLSVLRADYSNPVSDAEGTYYPYAWQGLAGVNAFSYNNTYMNLDVQRGYGFTAFQSTWRITDDRGLANIWHLNYSVSGGATSYMEYSGYVGPVVLSLDGSNPSYFSPQYSNVRYDIDMDGVVDKLAWAAPGSGVLGIDLNGDGQISDTSEFAFKQYVDGAQTDLEGLRAFDTNANGSLDAGDAQWAKFGVWEDKNADGQTQDGEYLTLDALGIATINLQSNGQMHSGAAAGGGLSADVTVMGDTTFTRTDGSTGMAADAMLAYQSGVYTQAAEADLARMALLFNQMANTAMTQDADPLGFVSMQQADTALVNEELLALQAA